VKVHAGDKITWKVEGGTHGVVFPTQADAEALLEFDTDEGQTLDDRTEITGFTWGTDKNFGGGTTLAVAKVRTVSDDSDSEKESTEKGPDAAKLHAKFRALPSSEACRRIDFEKIDIRPGIVNGTWILVVRGTKPCINMKVQLVPYVYIQQPDYWGIEVVGCLPDGICLPATAPYVESIPLAGITGKKGIEVIGATKQEKRDIPPYRRPAPGDREPQHKNRDS
jgi:hypothetical protein